jgi:N-dimethylarginine dimethylaminohydrolase
LSKATFLACAPEFFGVEYVINPWMQGNEGTVANAAARRQWDELYGLLSNRIGATVELIPPQPGLPDMVFTANGGIVRDGVCVPARMRPLQRQGEEPFFRDWFRARVLRIEELPEGTFFEGAGDALFGVHANGAPLLWCGFGFRTDRDIHSVLGTIFGVPTVSLHLIDPRYYHLDTCFCPLPGGNLLWYPPAFDEPSRDAVEQRVPSSARYAVGDEDAAAFACNAVGVESGHVVLNAASRPLTGWLESRGLAVHATSLTEFMKAGGAAKCLTLRLY